MGRDRATPPTSDPAYAAKIADFVHSAAPDDAFNQPAHFGQKFFNTSSANSGANAALLDLEVGGAPISKPTPDPKNAGFIYLRFQRGIMHSVAAQPSTQSILVVD